MISLEAEQITLGMCMRGDDLATAVGAGLHAGCFDEPMHQEIFGTMLEVAKVSGRISHEIFNKLPKYTVALQRMQDSAPITQNVTAYVHELKACYEQRQLASELIRLGRVIANRQTFSSMEPIRSAISETFNRLLKASMADEGPVKIDQAIDALQEKIERRVVEYRGGKGAGIPTGYIGLDVATGGGLSRGSMSTVAARTGQGKTTFAVNVMHAAAMAGYSCAYFTIEMPVEEILQKLISCHGSLSSARLRSGALTDLDLDKLHQTVKDLYGSKIWIDDKTKCSLETMLRRIQQIKLQTPLDLVVIDYIQQFRTEHRAHSALDQVRMVSGAVKQMAADENLAVLALAQLNREAAKDDGRPQVHHIKESGAIEQDSDLVLLIHSTSDTQADICIGKNRWGKQHTLFPVGLNLAVNKFSNLNINLDSLRND